MNAKPSDHAEERRKALRELFSGRGYYGELQQAINCGNSEWIRTIAKKQFAQIHDPQGQARFLRGCGQLFPDLFADDPWYRNLVGMIPFLESDSRQTPSIGASKGAERVASAKRPGRAPKLSSDFVHLAGRLWIEVTRQKGQARTTSEQLSRIALQFDEADYLPPAAYLEKKYAEEIKAYNSCHSNSKAGQPIKTWTQLVITADKDHLRGMRRLLSRCAGKSRNIPPELSGN